MTTMIAAPIGLGKFTSGAISNVKQTVRTRQAFSILVRGSCCSTGDKHSAVALRLTQDAPRHFISGAETSKGSEVGKALGPMAASAAFFLQTAGPSLAEVVPGTMLDDGQYWLEVALTSGAVAFVYLLVVPAIIYNYLRLRWYKRSALETYFQFLLVFIFFPGLLLLAPFINFRRLPKEGTEAP